jgi:hypothetical protein
MVKRGVKRGVDAQTSRYPASKRTQRDLNIVCSAQERRKLGRTGEKFGKILGEIMSKGNVGCTVEAI